MRNCISLFKFYLQDTYSSRREIRSIKVNPFAIMILLLSLVLIFFANYLCYNLAHKKFNLSHNSLLTFSLSPDGVIKQQLYFEEKQWAKKFFKFISSIGGSRSWMELAAMSFYSYVVLLFCMEGGPSSFTTLQPIVWTNSLTIFWRYFLMSQDH